MNISNLIYNQNNININNMVCLSEIYTKEDLENKIPNYSSKSFRDTDGNQQNMFCTYSEFKETYGDDIDLNNVYYNYDSDYDLLTKFLFYIDLDNYIMLNISNVILFNMPLQDLKKTIDNLINYKEQGKYNQILLYTFEGYKIQMLQHIVNTCEYSDSNLYELFMDYYTYTDFGFNSLTDGTIDKIINSKSEKRKKKTMELLKDFSDEIIIYRGEADKSTPYQQAYSWSISPSIASFFSLRYIEENGRIIIGKVNKKDVIEYFDSSEKEIFVKSDNVEVLNVYDFYTMEEIKNSIDNVLDDFSFFKSILANTEFPYDSKEHGRTHCLRVLLYSLILMDLLEIDNNSAYLMGFASIFHDYGRKNDEIDEKHGENSVKFIKNNYINDEIVNFLVKYHCIDEKIALNELKNNKNIGEINKNRIKQLYFVLKDSDTLDRVRFGLNVDISYLHYEQSIKMLLFANIANKYITL